LKASATISIILFVVFIVAIASAMARGLIIDCGCFAHSDAKVGWTRLLEDIGLLILSIYLFIYPIKTLTVEKIFSR
jgi:hypothetical protein